MKRMGNTISNKLYNPRNVKPPIPLDVDEVDSAMERFIRQKYENKSLSDGKAAKHTTGGTLSSEDEPPPLPPKTGKKFGFGLRAASSTFPFPKPHSHQDSPPTSPDRAFSPPPDNKPSRVFGASISDSGASFESKLATLRDMGFPNDKRNATVLKGLNGNLERTIESLVRLGEGGQPASRARTPKPQEVSQQSGATIVHTHHESSNSNNPFDRMPNPAPQTAGPGIQMASSMQQVNGQYPMQQQNSYNPFDQSQVSAPLEQSFQALNVSQPLFPHSTGGYPAQQHPQMQSVRHQYSMTPPISVPQYVASNSLQQQQQQPMANVTGGYNPFLQQNPSQTNPFMTQMQQPQSSNPWASQVQTQPQQQQFIYQQTQQQTQPQPQQYSYQQPQVQQLQQSTQPQYPSYPPQPPQAQQQNPYFTLQPQHTRVDKTSILALYNYPQLAPAPSEQQQQPSQDQPNQQQSIPFRSATMPILPSSTSSVPQAQDPTQPSAGSRNPFLTSAPPASNVVASAQGSASTNTVPSGPRHATQESLAINGGGGLGWGGWASESGRHSPDAFASLSARSHFEFYHLEPIEKWFEATMSPNPTLQASIKANGDPIVLDKDKPLILRPPSPHDLLLFLVAFRILNALSISTFFQPDEYFQSLEPAWKMAFGEESGAWITWEWKNQLRSAIHPALFAGVYAICDMLAKLLNVGPSIRADMLLSAPKVLQGVFAALGDFYTWKLSVTVYGLGSTESWAALALTALSPWQWFCSARTLSNCLETTLTITALYYWPWQFLANRTGVDGPDNQAARIGYNENTKGNHRLNQLTSLRKSLLLAALACILRPTNIIIWAWLGSSCLLGPIPERKKLQLARETIFCGSIVLAISLAVDRLYYGIWTFPPFTFLHFNLVQSLAIFYGSNPWHYYLLQGYPLLLITYIPFAVSGIYRTISPSVPQNRCQPPLSRNVIWQLGNIAIALPFILSLITHKEVRFIYPILPALHILSAKPCVSFFHHRPGRRYLLSMMFLVNICVTVVLTYIYQRAPLTVLNYIRHEVILSQPSNHTTTLGFLMPCHSTPWRSHLIFPQDILSAWALTCEPPLDIPPGSSRAAYLDEADQFYTDPSQWLHTHMMEPPSRSSLHPQPQGVQSGQSQNPSKNHNPESTQQPSRDGQPTSFTVGAREIAKRKWPEYVAFFGQLEPVMKEVLGDESGYRECWRGGNGFGGWHEDSRRQGGIVVWCAQQQQDEEKRRGGDVR
ncbi:MAG: hypothetical protein M1834_006328 [Cirrosporium novae-zelandiae]|nr:MAG: hypothetical protein M1834_006328 [Cirrosporium novae-zelandiae]